MESLIEEGKFFGNFSGFPSMVDTPKVNLFVCWVNGKHWPFFLSHSLILIPIISNWPPRHDFIRQSGIFHLKHSFWAKCGQLLMEFFSMIPPPLLTEVSLDWIPSNSCKQIWQMLCCESLDWTLPWQPYWKILYFVATHPMTTSPLFVWGGKLGEHEITQPLSFERHRVTKPLCPGGRGFLS